MTKGTSWSSRAFITAVALAAVGGCASGGVSDSTQGSGSDLSRVRLYSNVAELAADSKLVVEGTATGQSVADDVDPTTDFTLSKMKIVKVLRGPHNINVGNSIVVRQMGSDKQTPPVPILVPGQVYLLYLTPSGLDGALSSQYYITGANAGIYVQPSTGLAPAAAGKATQFSQVQRENGENLPASLSDMQAMG